MSHYFQRHQRLLCEHDFRSVFRSSSRLQGREATLLVRHNKLSVARLGVIISKKQVRYAVDRNRLRRIVRESFRLHQAALEGQDCIVLVSRPATQLSKREFRACIDKQWQRLMRA